MPKVVSINKWQNLVDANTIAAMFGRTAHWVNTLAREGRIRWYGQKNGVKVYRRFDPEEVRQDLLHSVEKPEVPRASA